MFIDPTLHTVLDEAWFYYIAIPLLGILAYLIVITRSRSLARAKRELEETVRKRTTELEKKNEELEKLSVVAREISDGVIIMDAEGKILWMNESFYTMAGFTREEFLNSEYGNASTIQELSSKENIDELVKSIGSDRKTITYDSNHRSKSGKTVWTRATLNPILNEDGQLDRIIGVYGNITERKEIENALRKSNKDLKDSIVYAKQIQEAIMPSPMKLARVFPDHFLFFKPKDIVSGDFYWFSHIENVLVVCAVDCTGHGVPGAFMSMIGNEFLHQIVNDSYINGPDQALNVLDKMITRSLHQKGDKGESKDGMDLGMCAIHLDTMWCQFGGAMNPMYIIRDGDLIILDAAKESIGGYSSEDKQFIAHEITLKEGDCVYLFSDGYIDQFGGEKGKKFMRLRFQELLLKNHEKPMPEQCQILEDTMDEWMGEHPQLDDMLIIGFRVKQPEVRTLRPDRKSSGLAEE